jgi:nucleoside triphosphatase
MTDKNKKYDYPEAIVGALIVNNEEKILLGQSVKWSDKWTVFGGHVELGEKMEEAVKREVKEETGLDVEVESQLYFSESIFSKEFHNKRHFVFLDYVCRYNGEGKVKVNEEFKKDEYKWVSIDEARKIDLAVGTKQIIEKYLKYQEQKNLLAGWKRCQADFDNYKKRQTELQWELAKYSGLNLIMQILPVLDNFHAATDHIPADQKDDPWVVGILYIQKQLEKILEDNGVKEIKAKNGDDFDPKIHEALHNGDQTKEKESKNKIA